MWDFAGDKRFRSLNTGTLRGADCCVMVYDVTDIDSLKALQKWHEWFKETCKDDTIPVVVIGNKADLTDKE